MEAILCVLEQGTITLLLSTVNHPGNRPTVTITDYLGRKSIQNETLSVQTDFNLHEAEHETYPANKC